MVAHRDEQGEGADVAPAGPHLAIENVTKAYGSVVAVDCISLDIERGEFFALLGPSGCGKTTLLRMLAGFEIPSSGRIVLGGQDLSRVPPYRRPVNMMFQSYALFPHMTVAGNVAFGLKQDRLPRREIAARVDEVLGLVQLDGLSRRKPHQLSGGQRQRVALARSLVKRPQLVLLDEPLAALDKKLREQTQFELMEIQRKVGITFVIVTHDQEEAMTVADRIAVMNKGRIVQVASPAEIYERPNCRYVAEFIGNVNIFEGEVSAVENGVLRLHAAEAEFFAPALAPALAVGAPASIAVRPEKIMLSRTASPEAGMNHLTGVVSEIGYFGSVSTYHVRLNSGRTVVSTQTNRAPIEGGAIALGETVHLTWQTELGVTLTS